jgi:hypothetical protein
MSIYPRARWFVTLGIIGAAALFMIRCTGSATGPTGLTLAVAGVVLNPTSFAAGTNSQGTVTLTRAAPTGGASISLSSSTVVIATVQTPLTIPAGATSATFTVTGVAAGTATITASLNGSSRQSAPFTVTGPSVTFSLSPSSIVGGNAVTGTVTLTAAAPAGGAVVSLAGGDPVTVPASVTVPTGSMIATFTVLTRAVTSTTSVMITASYGAASASATLSVTPPTVATASFGVTGPTETETCTLTNSGNTLNCTFNGSTSTAPGAIIAWDWTWSVATTLAQTTGGPVLTMPTITCSLIPPPPLPPGNPWFTMIVTLTVHDNLGNVSATATHSSVRLLPQGACGF